MNDRKRPFDPALAAFVIAVLVVVFLAGGYVASRGWAPFTLFDKGLSDTRTLVEEATQERPALLGERFYEGEGILKHDPGNTFRGLTLLQGSLPGGTQIRLVDMDGREVHRWDIDFFELWPDPSHLHKQQVPWTRFNYHTQGVELLEDGSVVFNIGGKGTAKLDKCGELQLTVNRRTHHSVTRTEDGGFWIPAHRRIADIPREYLFRGQTRGELIRGSGTRFNGYDNLVLRVDPDGKVIREFSVLGSMIDAGFESVLYDTTLMKPSDPTHVNDIEVVTAALAAKIDGVKAGDILVSLRQSHMLLVMDQHDGTIKWSYRGPWIRQHDPDILADGTVLVFNNGSEEFNFNRPRGSNLVLFDPADESWEIVYPQPGKRLFYTDIMGEQQVLPNGNILVTESRRGRVFEITPDGRLVWDFVLPYDDTHASLVAIAKRFPVEYFTVTDWSCG